MSSSDNQPQPASRPLGEDDLCSASAYHAAMSEASPAYVAYATTRRDVWAEGSAFQLAHAKLGHSSDYARHYVTHLLPLLQAHDFGSAGLTPSTSANGGTAPLESSKSSGSASAASLRFMDLGCAPGGLCDALLHHWTGAGAWTGVGVTLDPAEGGLAMQVASDRLALRFADVTDRGAFVDRCVPTAEECGTYDLVNLGIVLDQTVRMKRRDGAAGPCVSFGEQLYTQLLVASKALRKDGRGVVMMALKTDFPSLPEMLPTLLRLTKDCPVVRIIPTMYTVSNGKKQFYTAALGCCVSEPLAADIRTIWNLGTARYLAVKKAAIAAKRPREGETNHSGSPANGAGGGGGPKLASVQQLAVTAASGSNGYDARPTVQALYATVTGSDLDNFFAMVQGSLERQRLAQQSRSAVKAPPS